MLAFFKNKIQFTTKPSINIIQAAKDNKLVEVNKFLDEYEDCSSNLNTTDSYGNTALMWAAYNGHVDVVKAFLNNPKVYLNARNNLGCTALIEAVKGKQLETIKILLATPGLDINSVDLRGNSALMHAIPLGAIGIFKLLVAIPEMNVNLLNRAQHSILTNAIVENNIDIVEILLALPEIDVNIQGLNGTTSLMHACTKRTPLEIIKLLLAHPKMRVNIQDVNGNTALMYAINYHSNYALESLLAHKDILINSANYAGDSALLLAVKAKALTHVEKLIHAGADPTIMNKTGETAEKIMLADITMKYMFEHHNLKKLSTKFFTMLNLECKRFQEKSSSTQPLIDLSFNNLAENLSFILDNIESIQNLTASSPAFFTLAELLILLGEGCKPESQAEFDKTARQLYKIAALMGYGQAKTMVERWFTGPLQAGTLQSKDTLPKLEEKLITHPPRAFFPAAPAAPQSLDDDENIDLSSRRKYKKLRTI